MDVLDARAQVAGLVHRPEPASASSSARMVNLSLEHGNSDASCLAYVRLGIAPRAALRRLPRGLPLRQARPRSGGASGGSSASRPASTWASGTGVNPGRGTCAPASSSCDAPSRRRRRPATSRMRLSRQELSLITILLAAGEPLGEVQRRGRERARLRAEGAGSASIVDIVTAQLQAHPGAPGPDLPDLSSFNDADFDEGRFEQRLEGDPRLAIATCWYWIRKLQARFLAGDLDGSAIDGARRRRRLLWTSPARSSRWPTYHFYGALARAARCDAAPDAGERRRHLDGARRPPPSSSRSGLRAAPRTSATARRWSAPRSRASSGAWDDAAQLYEQAIRSARESGFVHNEALAYEIASRFYRARGFDADRRHLPPRGAACYARWGRGRQGAGRSIGQNPRLWDARPLAPHRHLRGAARAARPALGDQGVADHLERDRPRQAPAHAAHGRPRAGRRAEGLPPPVPGRAPLDRGGGHPRRRGRR